MAGGAGFQNYKAMGPSLTGAQVGAALTQQGQGMGDGGDPGEMLEDPAEEMTETPDMEAAEQPAPVGEPAVDEQGRVYDGAAQHSPAHTERILTAAIRNAMVKGKPQDAQPGAPDNRMQLRRLGVSDSEIDVGNAAGMWRAP